MYELTNQKLRALAKKHADLPTVEDMQADLGLVKAFCETIVNDAEEPEDLVEAFRLVAPALLQVNKAQKTVLELGIATDQLLTKEAVHDLIQELVSVISVVLEKHLTQEQVFSVVDELSPRMQEAVANASNSLPLQKPKLLEKQ